VRLVDIPGSLADHRDLARHRTEGASLHVLKGLRHHLDASTSACSILGMPLSSVGVWAISARPTFPARCASRSCSLPNVSKMAKSREPNLTAYQLIVPSSAITSSSALLRKSSTSSSLPSLASIRTNNARSIIFGLLLLELAVCAATPALSLRDAAPPRGDSAGWAVE